VDPVRNVDVLDFRVVVEFLIDRLVAGVGGKTGDIEGGTWSGGVGHVGGSGTNAAGAKASEEGSTVVLLRYGHREGAKDAWWAMEKAQETEGIPREEEEGGRDAK